MAKINWFPGHMAKTLRTLADEIKNIDIVIYVLDARAPKSSINPEFISIIGDKPIIYVFNKIDLVNELDINDFKNSLKTEKTDVITINSTLNGGIKKIEPLMVSLCKAKLDKYKSKGLKINLRAMVIGVPNSGKSTLINNLCGVKKTITGDKAGVTRGKQWVALKNGFEVLDTPGTLYPNITNQNIARNLALIGSIKNEVVDMGELCIDLLNYCKKHYYKNLQEKYQIKDSYDTTLEMLEDIAIKKNFLLKGGDIDYDKTCFAVIDDFRKGRLDKIYLEHK